MHEKLTSTSSRLVEAIMTGSVSFSVGFGSVAAETTTELISNACPLSLNALTK